jgi:putative oxidoreductase
VRGGLLIGRFIAGLYYLYAGLNAFTHLRPFIGYATSKGVPAPDIAVVVSHALLLLGAFCLLTGYQPIVGVAALVAFLIPVSFIMNAFWADRDPQARAMDLMSFTKNMGLLGSTLMFLAIPLPWPWSVDWLGRRLPRGPGQQFPVTG